MKTMIAILSLILFSAFGCGRPLAVPEILADDKAVAPMDDATTPDLAQPACETLVEAQCESRSDCHSLYEPCPPDRLCDVTPFLACANGAADCTWQPAGRKPGTSCPGVNMEWDYDGAGCVRRESCCTPRCGGTDSCTWCWGNFVCLEADTFC